MTTQSSLMGTTDGTTFTARDLDAFVPAIRMVRPGSQDGTELGLRAALIARAAEAIGHEAILSLRRASVVTRGHVRVRVSEPRRGCHHSVRSATQVAWLARTSCSIVTAAHCVSGSSCGVLFAHGYDDGGTPYGTWTVQRAYVPAAWQVVHDPRADAAYLVVRLSPSNQIRLPVQAVVGGNATRHAPTAGRVVTLAGYVERRDDEPVICLSTVYRTAEFPSIDYAGYAGGTSGSSSGGRSALISAKSRFGITKSAAASSGSHPKMIRIADSRALQGAGFGLGSDVVLRAA